MRPRNVLQIATLAVLCALALFAPAWGELVLYDDFGDPSARVRSDLWFGTEAFTGDLPTASGPPTTRCSCPRRAAA